MPRMAKTCQRTEAAPHIRSLPRRCGVCFLWWKVEPAECCVRARASRNRESIRRLLVQTRVAVVLSSFQSQYPRPQPSRRRTFVTVLSRLVQLTRLARGLRSPKVRHWRWPRRTVSRTWSLPKQLPSVSRIVRRSAGYRLLRCDARG